MFHQVPSPTSLSLKMRGCMGLTENVKKYILKRYFQKKDEQLDLFKQKNRYPPNEGHNIDRKNSNVILFTKSLV
jgi:hypothetical protein